MGTEAEVGAKPRQAEDSATACNEKAAGDNSPLKPSEGA